MCLTNNLIITILEELVFAVPTDELWKLITYKEKGLIKENSVVKLYILANNDNVKAYCYPADVEFLKAERTLLIYIFEDDFETKSFDVNIFKQMLFDKVHKK